MELELVAFVCASHENRCMHYKNIPAHLGWAVTECQIRLALKSMSFTRCSARAKPPISERNYLERLAWANEHFNWTDEQ
jgi:hypothetical protein